MNYTREQLALLARQFGAKDVRLVVAGIERAVKLGDRPEDVLLALHRNRPELFHGGER